MSFSHSHFTFVQVSAVLEVFPELIFTVKDILRPTLLTTLVSLVTKQQLEVSFLSETF